MAFKKWNIKIANKNSVADICASSDISEFLAQILVNRGYDSIEKIDEFINAVDELENPFVLADMEIAVERINKAVTEFEKIAVYGDYDCDGVTSTSILYTHLSLMGANVIYHIPTRDGEGYGLNCDAIKYLAQNDVKLIITVDNGISAINEVELANELGMQVIVTDHHIPGEHLPPAFAVINPHRLDCPSAYKDLAGVGVAFKLIAALENADYDYVLSQYSDIVAMGTIGDIVPLTGENRTIVKVGLEQLSQTDNVGLISLANVAKLNMTSVNSQSVAFTLVPRINAAGRILDASIAVKLLIANDPEEALAIAESINDLNVERKSLEESVIIDIQKQIEENPQILSKRVLIFKGANYHHGIIGIVCSKILEKYGKPTIILTENQDGTLTGSARSVDGFSIFDALYSCKDVFIKFGGHSAAGGMSLEKERFAEFDEKIQKFARKFHDIMPTFSYDVDMVIAPNDLNLANIKSLEILQPFGAKNQYPSFMIKGAKLQNVTPVGDNKHLRLGFTYGAIQIKAMLFRTSLNEFMYKIGETLDFVADISINLYNGNEYLSMTIRDIRPTDLEQERILNAKSYYDKFVLEEKLSFAVIEKIIPTRDEIAVVYRYINKSKTINGDIDNIYFSFSEHNINYIKYRIILNILTEAKLIKISLTNGSIEIQKADGKVDLQETKTYKRLIEMNG